jgi:catechol 2,3-dioxygenase-like lactoylglutathione lyase family enzyme
MSKNSGVTARRKRPAGRSASPLGSHTVVAFAASAELARARSFYRDTLRLRLVSEHAFALTFDVKGTLLRVSRVREVTKAEYTVLGFEVEDVAATAKALQRAGVELQRYPGMPQDDLGIWTAPDGTEVAWFKDPDGNTLSISRH